MSSDHQKPLAAFLVVTLACGFFMAFSLRNADLSEIISKAPLAPVTVTAAGVTLDTLVDGLPGGAGGDGGAPEARGADERVDAAPAAPVVRLQRRDSERRPDARGPLPDAPPERSAAPAPRPAPESGPSRAPEARPSTPGRGQGKGLDKRQEKGQGARPEPRDALSLRTVDGTTVRGDTGPGKAG
jgi:hypothetical protein